MGSSLRGTEERDNCVRCVEKAYTMQDGNSVEALKAAILEAEREVDIAERHLKNKQLALNSLKKKLQDAVIAGVGGMKISKTEEVEKVKKPEPPKDEATRRAEVRRRWRILGMKIKLVLERKLWQSKEEILKMPN